MSASATLASVRPLVNVARIHGRVASKPRRFTTRDGGSLYATLVKLPAADEYSSAATVEVRTVERIGDIGDEWTGDVRIGGSARPFTYKDKETGDSKAGTEVSIWLTGV